MSGDVTGNERIIGRLEAQQASMDERLERIEQKVDSLTETVSQAKGGWKVIWAVAGAGGVIGASLMKLLGMVKGAP